MVYKPTPRDLFRPPPQAHRWGKGESLREIREEIEKCYPDYYHPVQMLFMHILYILEDHDERMEGKL